MNSRARISFDGRCSRFKQATVFFITLGMACNAVASPTGGVVTSGSGSISRAGATTTITQNTHTLGLGWTGFNVAANETVNFVQPSASSIAVNRIHDVNGTQVLGRLNANGQVYLINPNGVLFGAGAQVNVGGLVASTLDVADGDLLGGKRTFKGDGAGSVVNHGTLTAADGGSIALIGNHVRNEGVIVARLGTVALGAGSQVTLDFAGDELLSLTVDKNAVQALAENRSLIRADGGAVLMSAGARDSLVASVVNNTGVIEARTLVEREGKIILLAGMKTGVTHAAGTLDASAPDGGDGGFIDTSAAFVSFADDLKITTLAASGNTGTWLIDPYNITISSAGSSNVSIDFSNLLVLPIGSGSNINNNTLASYLGSNNITVATGSSGSEAGNITVNAAVSWNAATTLTLSADATTGGIFLNANINGTNANSGLVLNSGAGGISQAGGTVQAGTLAMSTSGSINLGQAGNAITRLGASSSGGDFALRNGTALTVTGAVTSGGDLTLQSGGLLSINADLAATADNAVVTLGHGGGGYSLNRGARVTLADVGAALNIGTTGAENSYTLIRDLAGLQAVGSSGYYALAGDIDASATSETASFSTIANFSGQFTGLGHNIVDLTIHAPALNQVGLFGLLSGTVRDFTLANVAVTGQARVGGAVGNVSSGRVTNVHVTGSVTAAAGQVGGLAGWNDQGTITGSSSAAAVSGPGEAGGLVGRLRAGTITNSYATGSVTSSGNLVGGLVGAISQGGTLTNVYASGRVTGAGEVGGLIGGELLAGVISATNAYWDIDTTGRATSFSFGTGINTANTRTEATYAGFDFANTWVLLPGDTRPMLLNEYSKVVATPAALQLMALDLAADYTLGADINLASSFTPDVNGNYAGLWGASGFVSLGGDSTPFTGSLDGRGHTISGLMINRDANNYVGLFGYVTGDISNVALSGGSVTGFSNVGGLVGYLLGGSVTNASSEAAVMATSTGDASAGGLVAVNNAGEITASFSGGDVTGAGYNVGGLVGYNSNGGLVARSYATGDVTGTNTNPGFGYIGGLVGSNGYVGDGGVITQSYATGAVSGSTGPIGGFVGHNEGTITDSYATGQVTGTGTAGGIGGFVGVNFTNGTIARAYSTGEVTGSDQVGGFAGYNNNVATAITGSYWNTQTSGFATGIGGGAAGVTGLTTAQFQNTQGFMTLAGAAGWNFQTTWAPPSAGYYPELYALSAVVYLGATSDTKVYGDANPALSLTGQTYGGPASYVFGPAGDAFSGSFTPGTSATNTSGVGSYAITAGNQTSTGGVVYRTVTDGVLTVTPRAITVAADNQSKTYGDANPALTYSFTSGNLVNGDTLTGALATTADATSNVGDYDITQGSLSASANYALTFTDGTLTIDARAITVTADNQSKTYGNVNPGADL